LTKAEVRVPADRDWTAHSAVESKRRDDGFSGRAVCQAVSSSDATIVTCKDRPSAAQRYARSSAAFDGNFNIDEFAMRELAADLICGRIDHMAVIASTTYFLKARKNERRCGTPASRFTSGSVSHKRDEYGFVRFEPKGTTIRY